jgi:rod shape-determining protein MreC
MRDSRRARIVLAVLLLIAATFVIVDLRGGSSSARGAGSSVFGPIERAVTTITEPIGNFFSAVGALVATPRRSTNSRRRTTSSRPGFVTSSRTQPVPISSTHCSDLLARAAIASCLRR